MPEDFLEGVAHRPQCPVGHDVRGGACHLTVMVVRVLQAILWPGVVRV